MHCLSVPCPSLTDPNNGMITCSLGDDGVPSYEDTCNFTCNTGYVLTGSDSRICQSDGRWSGTEVMCRRGIQAVNMVVLESMIYLGIHKFLVNQKPASYFYHDDIMVCWLRLRCMCIQSSLKHHAVIAVFTFYLNS